VGYQRYCKNALIPTKAPGQPVVLQQQTINAMCDEALHRMPEASID
jgi:hypothetical protein